MKLKITKDAMLTGLQRVQSVIGPRTTLPVLQNILFKAEKDKLWLLATDLDLTVRTGVAAEVAKAGATTLPARRCAGLFKELPPGDIELDTDDKDQTSIRSGSAFFKIIGISEDEFPPSPRFEAAKNYTLDQGTFRDMLRNVSCAASTDESRYVLNGILLSFRGDKLAVVATDGRRMALYEQEVEFPKEAEADLIIPAKTVNELLRTLGEKGAIRIQATDKQVAFEFDDMYIMSKLMEGSYPNFRQVIPAQGKDLERIKLEREALLTTVRRVAVVASEASNSVRLSFSKNKLEVSANAPDVGEAREVLPIEYTGKAISVAFNPMFLMDPLRNLVSDEVFMELTNDLSPGVLKCNVPFLYVLMPMRLN